MRLIDINQKISLNKLRKMSFKIFGGLVKAVVDIEKEIMVVDGEMHADEERFLLDNGSKQNNLWGINLYPDFFGTSNFIEFDSIINIRPRLNNLSREIKNENIRKKIVEIVNKLIIK